MFRGPNNTNTNMNPSMKTIKTMQTGKIQYKSITTQWHRATGMTSARPHVTPPLCCPSLRPSLRRRAGHSSSMPTMPPPLCGPAALGRSAPRRAAAPGTPLWPGDCAATPSGGLSAGGAYRGSWRSPPVRAARSGVVGRWPAGGREGEEGQHRRREHRSGV